MTHHADENEGPQATQIEGYLTVSNVHKSYHNAQEEIRVLDGITFSASEDETVGIVGPNGCGKSTLLLSIAGLQGIDGGEIKIRGSTPGEVSVGLVFQDYRESLLPWRTVEDNIAFPLELKGIARRQRKAEVLDFLERLKVELPCDRYPYELSGGQQQTVHRRMGRVARRQVPEKGLSTAPGLLVLIVAPRTGQRPAEALRKGIESPTVLLAPLRRSAVPRDGRGALAGRLRPLRLWMGRPLEWPIEVQQQR